MWHFLTDLWLTHHHLHLLCIPDEHETIPRHNENDENDVPAEDKSAARAGRWSAQRRISRCKRIKSKRQRKWRDSDLGGEYIQTQTNWNKFQCYTMCIAQMAGLLDRKNQFSVPKIQTQIDTVMPIEMKETAIRVLDACKGTFTNPKIKDSCEKVFISTKCMYDFDPASFMYPWYRAKWYDRHRWINEFRPNFQLVLFIFWLNLFQFAIKTY